MSDVDVQRIVETAAHRLVRLLQQRGLLDDTAGDTLAEQEPLLAALAALELIEKLAALIPPSRLNLVRYHGILAPNARDRSQVVPAPPSPAAQTSRGDPSAPEPDQAQTQANPARGQRDPSSHGLNQTAEHRLTATPKRPFIIIR